MIPDHHSPFLSFSHDTRVHVVFICLYLCGPESACSDNLLAHLSARAWSVILLTDAASHSGSDKCIYLRHIYSAKIHLPYRKPHVNSSINIQRIPDRAAFPLTTRIASSEKNPVGCQCPACYYFKFLTLLRKIYTHVPCCRACISQHFISSCRILRFSVQRVRSYVL